MNGFSEPPEGTSLAINLILDFWPPELWGNTFLLFEVTQLWYFVMAALGNQYRIWQSALQEAQSMALSSAICRLFHCSSQSRCSLPISSPFYYKQCCLITLGEATLLTSTVNQNSDPCATGYRDGLCVRGRNCRELERAASWQNRKLLAPAGWGNVGILSEVRASHYPRESRFFKKTGSV